MKLCTANYLTIGFLPIVMRMREGYEPYIGRVKTRWGSVVGGGVVRKGNGKNKMKSTAWRAWLCAEII